MEKDRGGSFMKEQVLVTGGTGFLGLRIVAELLKQELSSLDKSASTNAKFYVSIFCAFNVSKIVSFLDRGGSFMKEQVLVTGGTGFLGLRIVAELLKQDYRLPPLSFSW
jgi:nucleoside-diphosphate-sugar epimerase